MCYESDGLFRKLRAFENMRRDRQKAEAARQAAKRPAVREQPAPAAIPSREVEQPTVTV